MPEHPFDCIHSIVPLHCHLLQAGVSLILPNFYRPWGFISTAASFMPPLGVGRWRWASLSPSKHSVLHLFQKSSTVFIRCFIYLVKSPQVAVSSKFHHQHSSLDLTNLGLYIQPTDGRVSVAPQCPLKTHRTVV